MGRFVERGPPSEPLAARGLPPERAQGSPSKPAHGLRIPTANQAPGTSSGSAHTAPGTSTTVNKGRIPAQTANVHTTSLHQKK